MPSSTDNAVPGTGAAGASAIVKMRAWSEEEFRHSETQWQHLLGRSTSDPVFMSWSWQWSWWRTQAAALGSTLRLMAAYSQDGKLIGLAPLHLRRALHRKPISAMRMETLGSTWRHRGGVFSEYLDFIVDTSFEDAFVDALGEALLADPSWCDLIIANTKRGGVAERFVRKHLNSACYVREVDPAVAQLTVLPPVFADYVRALHPTVRRKLWNQRVKLASPHLVDIGPESLATAFDRLNDFHQQRWGSRLFVGHARAFHMDFARLAGERGNLYMSILNVAGRAISVAYNIRTQGTEYNIQSGFDSATDGISPGYLHFGFCMERACHSGVQKFDFLAGDGRTRDYKRDFITQGTELITFQCIRQRSLAWLYRKYDQRSQPAALP